MKYCAYQHANPTVRKEAVRKLRDVLRSAPWHSTTLRVEVVDLVAALGGEFTALSLEEATEKLLSEFVPPHWQPISDTEILGLPNP